MSTVLVEVDAELLKLADAQAAEFGRSRDEVLSAVFRRGGHIVRRAANHSIARRAPGRNRSATVGSRDPMTAASTRSALSSA